MNGQQNGHAKSITSKTDYRRWRLKDDRGRQTWHYLTSDEEIKQWPQTIADKYHLGLDTGLPDLPKAKTPLQAAENGINFFSKLQLEPGNWACEYGGPMFLLPGFVITLYVIDMPLTQPEQTEIVRYVFNMQNWGEKNGGDGGWGLHIEGDSSVFGTAMNYVVLRLLGVSADEPRMVKARECLHNLGGAVYGPHWAKFWLSVLGVMKWDIVNPVPPELWLLPDWVPIAPWRWWIHMRMVFLPMSYIWSKQWTYPRADSDPLIRELRQELFTSPHREINFAGHRNSISPADNYHPKTWVLNLINLLLVWIWIPFMRWDGLIKKAEDWVWFLISREDENSDYGDLAPVNAPMNTLCCFIKEGPEAESVIRHRDRLQDYFFISKDGMMANGTNGVQNWDTAFAIQAVVDCGLETKPEYHTMLLKSLEFLEDQQFVEHPVGYETSSAYSDPPTQATSPDACYRHPRRGAWGFSNRSQGYTVSDCTAEAIKAIMMLQSTLDPKDPSQSLFPALLSDQRIQWAIDILLTMQNSDGSCSSYEPMRGSTKLEYLNAAEVFGRIMVEYPYPECTTACITALERFRKLYPSYRKEEIDRFITRAVDWIRGNQAADGSWYGSWGICYTYAGWFALESLKSQGETYENSERVRRACQFFLDRQEADGGWGESYKSCETVTWCRHPDGSQVVQTAWVIIALLEAGYPNREPIERAVRLIMHRQQANGEWLQEGIEGVFNKSCMISYPNYKFIFPIKALGMYSRRFGDAALLNGGGAAAP
ncbi:terpene synthase [Sphaerulina musiva SO2202]|uniref:Terpene cyclase/mutase family member n=1 Tax=Sphaerulina musiva (strain SO2202) TaxID=692275 RepID=N1QKG4_SPHMS|nr:terpene synthase [Sphaerulina musiva SO2202]EMF12290.1 terpene synthase [Sphaerulina musiva SO2202]